MIAFYLTATVLVVAVLVLLLSPWWRKDRRVAGADSSGQLSVEVHRDRLAELERDRNDGILSGADFAAATEEIRRQLLDDAAIPGTSTRTDAGQGIAVLITVAVTALSAGLYAALGTPTAVLPAKERAQAMAADMSQLAAELAKKLERNPQNPDGWAMLARAYKNLERWDDAEKAFKRIGAALDSNAGLQAEYAELLLMKDGSFGHKARQLVATALVQDPNNGLALFLGGSDAFDQGQMDVAAELWSRLLPQLEPESEDARMIESSLARARAAMPNAATVSKTDPLNTAAVTNAATAVADPKGISGRIELAPALAARVSPGDTLFVFARNAGQSGMPLAALRIPATAFPLDFALDRRHALVPDTGLASADQVIVEARVSRSGNATPASGDLTGTIGPVKPGSRGLRLVIDRTRP